MERITVNLDAIWNYSELDLVMKEFLIKKMREKGLKLTPQRLGVIDVLVKKNLLYPKRTGHLRPGQERDQGG
jgi:hypothetical protein